MSGAGGKGNSGRSRSNNTHIKSKLKEKGVLSEAIADQLDKAAEDLNISAFESIFNDIKKAGVSVFDFAKRVKVLGDISAENTKRIRENEEALKSLNTQYNDINLQISNQIDIEKNRAQTIREINKIQAEGAVSVQRARVKGLLESASPFISESAKTDIQNQLDLNADPGLIACAPVCKNCHSCVLATYSNEKWARYKCLRWTCMCSYTRPAKRTNDPISVGVPPDRFGPIEQNNAAFMKPWLQGFVSYELKMAPPLQGKEGVTPNNATALMAATQQEDFQL